MSPAGPNGTLAFSNGKFYGLTNTGGLNGAGVIFLNGTHNVYTKRSIYLILVGEAAL